MERKFYDQGWNDRIDNRPLILPATKDYIDGWKDCNGAKLEDQKHIN